MLLKHYYHMYANGLWEIPFQEHLTALTNSTLIDNLNFIGVGIVGNEANRLRVKKALPSEFCIVSEADSGWEQVTLSVLSKDILEPSKILYAHTKGAANNRHNQAVWRREMTEAVVKNWKPCVKFLDQYDAVGCRWTKSTYRHYSGTFWWSTSSYISSLPELSRSYRDDAEIWIGKSSVGGSHVNLNIDNPDLSEINFFGRIFATEKTVYGSPKPFCDPPFFLPGDEFVGFLSSPNGSRIINQLSEKGLSYYVEGDTIIVR